MRIGLVSPYSWSYQGGVNRHVEALAEEFLGERPRSPCPRPGRPPIGSAGPCTGPRREPRELPDYPIAARSHGRVRRQRPVSNLALLPGRRRRGARAARFARGDFDVLHVHEPLAPLVGWNAVAGRRTAGGRNLPRLLDQARSRTTSPGLGAPPRFQPAFGPDRGLRGRRLDRAAAGSAASTTIIPNGVDVEAAPRRRSGPGEELRILFVGRPEERKGLPILLTAFNALVEHVPCRLTVIGAEREDVLRYLADPELLRPDRRPRPRLRRGSLARAARRRRPLRAVALGRELRHGPDRGLRRRHPGDRLRDRRLQRRRHRRRRRPPGAARRPPAPRRGAAARSTTSRSGWRRWAPPPAQSAERYAWPRVADQVTDGLRARDGGAAAGRRRAAHRPLGGPAPG